MEVEAVPSVEDDFEMAAKGMMSPAVAVVAEVVMAAVEVEVGATFWLACEVAPDKKPWNSNSDMAVVLNPPVLASVEMIVASAVEMPVQTTASADSLHHQG